MQMPGGYLATRYGAKHVFMLGVLCTSLMTLLTPIAAHNTVALIILRVVEGVGEVC